MALSRPPPRGLVTTPPPFNKRLAITWELCIKYYYMVTSRVSDVDLRQMLFLEVDVTGLRKFLCSKDRFY